MEDGSPERGDATKLWCGILVTGSVKRPEDGGWSTDGAAGDGKHLEIRSRFTRLREKTR